MSLSLYIECVKFKTVVTLKGSPCLHPDSHHPIFPFYLYESGKRNKPPGNRQGHVAQNVARVLTSCPARWRGFLVPVWRSGAVSEKKTEAWEGIPIEEESQSGWTTAGNSYLTGCK